MDLYCHRRVVLAESDKLVPATDLGAEFASVLLEQPLELRLRQARSPDRGFSQLGKVQIKVAEWHLRSPEAGDAARGFNPTEQTPVTQQVHDPSDESAGPRGLADFRPALQHQRSHSRQTQFSGQH